MQGHRTSPAPAHWDLLNEYLVTNINHPLPYILLLNTILLSSHPAYDHSLSASAPLINRSHATQGNTKSMQTLAFMLAHLNL